MAVTLWETESEAAFFFQGILHGVDVVCPGETVVVERVVDGVVWSYGE